MAVVHYKFKNSVAYDSITFDGLSISLRDLKSSILKKKKMRAEDTDLQVVNAQTGEEYSSPSLMIPKNTSLIIARIPVGGGKKSDEVTAQTKAKKWAAFRKETQAAISAAETGGFNTEKLKQSSDLVNAQSSEIEKIAEMMKQSTKDFDPSNYTYKVGPSGTPNSSYICRRCGKGGHFIQNCPNDPKEGSDSPSDIPRMKRPTGIPVDSMVFMDEPLPGTYKTHTGKYAVPKIDVAAYVEGKKERPPFLPDVEKKSVVLKKPIPKELKCPLCGDLARDAVVIPCCGISYCDECIRDKLLESEDHVCPSCDSMDVSPDGLIANQMLRRAVTNFQNETGYVNIKHAQAKAVEAAKAAAAATRVLNKIQNAPVVPRGPSVLDYKPPANPVTPPVPQPVPSSASSFPTVKVSSTQEQMKLNTSPQRIYTPASVAQEPPTPTQDEPVRSSNYTQQNSSNFGTHENMPVGEPVQTLVGQVVQHGNRVQKRPVTTGGYDPYYKPSLSNTSVPPPTVPPYPPLTAYPPPVVPLPFVPPPVMPTVRPPMPGPPMVPPGFPPALPPRPTVPIPRAPLNLPKPLSETEFLQEKNRLLHEELKRKDKEKDPLIEFQKKLEEKRVYRSRSRSRTPRTRSRSLSRPRYRSRSRGRSFSRSPRRSLTPRRSPLSPRRSYSPRRYSPRRSRSPRYSPRRYFSPRRSRSRSLSPRGRYRSYSRSPIRRRSLSRSRSWSRKRSPFRRTHSRSPIGRRSPFRRSISRGRYTPPPRRSLSPYRRSPLRRSRSRSPIYRRSRSPARFSPKRKRSPLRRSPQRRSKERQPARARSPVMQKETKRKPPPVKQRDRDKKEVDKVPNDNARSNKNTKTVEKSIKTIEKIINTVEPNKENIPTQPVQSRSSLRTTSNNIVVNLVDTTTTDDNSELEEKQIKTDDSQNKNSVPNKDNDNIDKSTKSTVESKEKAVVESKEKAVVANESKALGDSENKQIPKSESKVSKSEKDTKQKSRSRSKSKDKQMASAKQSKPRKRKSPKKREKSLSLSPERVKEPLRMPGRDRYEGPGAGGRGRVEVGRGRVEVGRDRYEGNRSGGYGREWDRDRDWDRESDPYFRGRQNVGYKGRDFRGRGRGSDFRGNTGDYRGPPQQDFRPPDFRGPSTDYGGYPPMPDAATMAQYSRDYQQRGSTGFPTNYAPNFPYPPPRDPRNDPNFQGMVRDEDIVKFEQYKQFYDFYTNSRTYGFPPPPLANTVPSGQTPPQGPPPAPPGTTPLTAPPNRAGSPSRRRSRSPRRRRSRSPGRRDGKDRRDKERGRDHRDRRSPDRRREDRTNREEHSPEHHKRDRTPEKKYTTEESDADAQNTEMKSKEHEAKESKKEKKARKKKEKESGEKKKKKKKDKEKTKKEKAEKKAKKSKMSESSENEEVAKKTSKRKESQNESDSEKSDSDTQTESKGKTKMSKKTQSDSSDHEMPSNAEKKQMETVSIEKEVEEDKHESETKTETVIENGDKIKRLKKNENVKSEPLSESELNETDDGEAPDKSGSQKPEKRRSLKREKPEAVDSEEIVERKKAKLEETVKEEVKEEKMDTSGLSPAGSEGFDDIPHPEDELMLEPPELSKWEKWEKDDDPYELSPEPTKKKEKWKPTKQTFLPRSVIEKAEHALAQKVMKPTTVSSAVSVIQPAKNEGKSDTKDLEPARTKRDKSPVVEPKRRVFMDSEKKTVDRKVASKQQSVKITVTGNDKRKVATENDLRNKLREKRGEGDNSRESGRSRDRNRERSAERRRKDSHSYKDRSSGREYSRQESRGARGDSNKGRDSVRIVSRKDSVIDDSRFVPDYDDSYSEDDNSEDSSSDTSSDEEVVHKKHKHKKNKHKKEKKQKKKKEKKKKKHKLEKEKKLKSAYMK